MKKYYGILLAIILVVSLSFSGCTKEESKGNTDSENAKVEQINDAKSDEKTNTKKTAKEAATAEKTAAKVAEESGEIITASEESTPTGDDNYDLDTAQELLTQDLLGEGYTEEEIEEMLAENPDLIYDYAVDYEIVYEN